MAREWLVFALDIARGGGDTYSLAGNRDSFAMTNCGGLFLWARAAHPDRVAVLQDGRQLTYAQLDSRANQVAHALAGLGMGTGDGVAVLIRNDQRYIEAVFGALRLGAVVTPVTTRGSYPTLRHILADSEAKVLIASADFAGEAGRLAAETPSLRHVFVADGAGGMPSFESWRDRASDAPVLAPRDSVDIAMLCYTSGSTGMPKGVPLTHGGIMWCATTMRRTMLLGPEQRCLLAVPLFHANATTCGLWPLLECGGSVVIQRDFEARAFLEALSAHGCTYTTGVPAMYKLLLRAADDMARLDFSALRFVLCSSSEVPAELLSRFKERFGVAMIEGYGLTEGGPMVLSNPRWGITKPGTSGLPLPGAEIRVVARDNPSRDVPDGEIGELLVRSPGVTPGYHRRPDLSAERLLDGGWLRTLDLVRRDPDGYVKVIGRLDDMIICGGENIYPTEIENLLLGHPGIADAAVVPRRDEIKGEVPVAFVVIRAGTELSEDAIKRYALEHGPAYAHPRAVYRLEELPLTAAKKVDRAALKAMVRGRAGPHRTETGEASA